MKSTARASSKRQSKCSVFPIAHRGPILKVISEKQGPLSPANAKEDKRVGGISQAERDEQNAAAASRRAINWKQAANNNVRPTTISRFRRYLRLRSSYLHHEQLTPGIAIRSFSTFAPDGSAEHASENSISSSWIVWIDPVDKQVIRLEARPKA